MEATIKRRVIGASVVLGKAAILLGMAATTPDAPGDRIARELFTVRQAA
jgi:hypothetical protein